MMQEKQDVEVPEGVDLSDPIEVPDNVQIADISLVSTEEDLLNLTVQRIIDLEEGDPIYEAISSALVDKARPKWYKKGDYEIFKTFIRKHPASVYKHFEDLRELRFELKKKKRKANRRKGRK